MPDLWFNVDENISGFPVNILPLIDNADFVTIEDAVVYNATGMELVWNFIDIEGTRTNTVFYPTSGDDYDWINEGNGMYSIEFPATGGVSGIENDSEGFAWITGSIDGILPFRGPIVGFRPSHINHALISGDEFLGVDAFKPEFEVSGDQLSVYAPDNTTIVYTRTLTTDAGASPIIKSET